MQTDRHTTTAYAALSIASRGKNDRVKVINRTNAVININLKEAKVNNTGLAIFIKCTKNAKDYSYMHLQVNCKAFYNVHIS